MKEGSQIGKGREQNDAGKGFRDPADQVWYARGGDRTECESFRSTCSNRGSEALTYKRDSRWGDGQGWRGEVVYHGQSVGDQAIFCGRAGGESKATVVEGDNVEWVQRCRGSQEIAIDEWAGTTANMGSVSVD